MALELWRRRHDDKCLSYFLPYSLSYPGVEGGFDLTEEKFEYDEDVKIVILPDYLEIARDGLGGLPDIVRDRVWLSYHPSQRFQGRRGCSSRAWSALAKLETRGEKGTWGRGQILADSLLLLGDQCSRSPALS